MRLHRAALVASLVLTGAWTASAQAVSVRFDNGHVTVRAQNAPLRTILAEWARVGGSRIVNAEQVAGTPLTLELTNVTERQALNVLLRGVSGYIAAPRRDGSATASSLDRIVILATSAPVRQAAAPASPAPRTTAPVVFVPDTPGAAVTAEGVIITAEPGVRNAQQIQDQIREAAARAAAARDQAGDAVDEPDDDPAADGAPAQPRFRRPATAPVNPFGNVRGTARPGEVAPAPQDQPGR